MGVRKYFIFTYEGCYYTGPKAYRKLLDLHAAYSRARRNATKPAMRPTPLVLKEGCGWRKNILIVYQAVKKLIPLPTGALQEVHCRKGMSNARYREVLNWIGAHKARLIPPRKQVKLEDNF